MTFDDVDTELTTLFQLGREGWKMIVRMMVGWCLEVEYGYGYGYGYGFKVVIVG
jgi:hypothetical protein